MKIIIGDEISFTSNMNLIDTGIHIECNGQCFPSEGWTDFTFPILEEWKNNLINAKNADNFTFKLYFHDGPFWLEVYKHENMELKIECINGKFKKRTELTTSCGYYDLIRELYNAFKSFSKILYRNDMYEGRFYSVYQQTLLSIGELKKIINKG